MDLIDANLAKTLECPVCPDVFDEPKFLVCGHNVWQKCVDKISTPCLTKADTTPGLPCWMQPAAQKCVKCRECGKETKIPPGGLATNYRLVGGDLVCCAQKPLMDVHACNDCGKQAPVADMFTCDTCEDTLKTTPLWVCAVCAMKRHHGHAMSDCNKATQQQIEDTCHGIVNSGNLASMYVGMAAAHLTGALEKTMLISQLLNQKKRGFSRLEERTAGADDNLTQEDLTASL